MARKPATKKKHRQPDLDEITFSEIPNSVVIINRGGALSQHTAAFRRGEVYAKVGSGYVGLRRSSTSVDKMGLKDFDLGTEFKFCFTGTGRIVADNHEHAKSPCSPVMSENEQ